MPIVYFNVNGFNVSLPLPMSLWEMTFW